MNYVLIPLPYEVRVNTTVLWTMCQYHGPMNYMLIPRSCELYVNNIALWSMC